MAQRASPQQVRLVFSAIYVAALFITSWIAFGRVYPGGGGEALWFFSGLFAIVIGSLLETPFFATPTDALSYSLSALLAVSSVALSPSQPPLAWLRLAVIAYALLVLACSVVAIAGKDSGSDRIRTMAAAARQLSGFLGQPRVLFSIVFLYALVMFHRGNSRELISLFVAWALLVVARPLENTSDLIRRVRTSAKGAHAATAFGRVAGHQIPGTILVRHDGHRPVNFGDILVIGSDEGGVRVAVALDHVGTADDRWLRAVDLELGKPACAAISKELELGRVAPQEVWRLLKIDLSAHLSGSLATRCRDLIGLVAVDSKLDTLRFEVLRPTSGLRRGRVAQAPVGDANVLYQILDGATREEIVLQKNTRGYVVVTARKIGIWDAANQRLVNADWLPQPNTPVFLFPPAAEQDGGEAVGFIPETGFGVRIDPNAIVTHNTAILGVLGSGKSCLALELVERIVASGIKVVVVDLTNQYRSELRPYVNDGADEADDDALRPIGVAGRNAARTTVDEGGSVRAFAAALQEQLITFLASPREIRIINLASFEVWRQDGKMFSGAAPMAQLSPVEITRLVAEGLLEAMRRQGMTDQARCCLVLEEAHSLVPEWNAVAQDADKAATNGTAKAIMQGRKFGFGCILVTQRTANVTKSILNQCNTVFALQVFDATGIEFLANYLGQDFAGVLSGLDERHAVVYGRALSSRVPLLIRLNDRNVFLRSVRNEEPVGQAPAAEGGGPPIQAETPTVAG